MSLINILSKKEEKEFYLIKKLSILEKMYFFKLPNQLLEKVLSFELNEGKIIFILKYGYFRAFNQFFEISSFLEEDINFIKDKYKLETKSRLLIKSSRLFQYKQIIKQYLGIKDYSSEIENILQNEANILSSNFIHRKKIFYALVDLSIKLKIEIPSYTKLIKIITNAINTNKKDIVDKLKFYENDENLKVLDEFLEKDLMSKNRYNLTL